MSKAFDKSTKINHLKLFRLNESVNWYTTWRTAWIHSELHDIFKSPITIDATIYTKSVALCCKYFD